MLRPSSPCLPRGDDLVVGIRTGDPDWDRFVDRVPGGSHLQTARWAEVKARAGWRVLRIQVRQGDVTVAGCQLLVRPLGPGSIAYCPRGPLLLDADPARLTGLLDALEQTARRARILYLKVQPPAQGEWMTPMLSDRGYVMSDLPAATVATARVDLRREERAILAGMRHGVRTNIRRAGQRGVQIRAAGRSGMEAFGRLLRQTSARQGFVPFPIDYYAAILDGFAPGERAELLLAEVNGEPVSGALIVGWGDTVVDKMNAWSGAHADCRPNDLLQFSAMRWARDRGYRFYDLDGVSEPHARAHLAGRPPPDHHGPTQFKLGLGGDVVLFPEAYDRSVHPLLGRPVQLLAPRIGHMERVANRLAGRGPR